MTKEDKFKVWEYYYLNNMFSLTEYYLNIYFPCEGSFCAACQMSVDYKCTFCLKNGLDRQEIEEFYNLHPEYKLI